VSLLRALAKDARFAAGLLRRKPFSCLIQVTNRCNLTCSFCEFWSNPAKPREELTLADFERIGEELAELGTFLISIEGGEPFVRGDLIDIVRTLSRRHITALFTSGWFVSEANARALWNAGLTHASVSIDFPDRERHDRKRGQEGVFERAWRAVDLLRDTAPRQGKQVNVMTVLMQSNWRDIEALLRMSAARSVGHQVTLLSTDGTRRGNQSGDAPPPVGAAAHFAALWESYPHLRFFREYFEHFDAFLTGGPMPTCRAGVQSLNIDHVGDVSACIERIDKPVGNVREAPVNELVARLASQSGEVAACQACWTACRGLQQGLADGGSLSTWIDMTRRTRTV
jgi:MoaA/NifB/PqqE/SkfB family radical SAM enzyme